MNKEFVKKNCFGFKYYTVAGLLLIACFHTGEVKAMEVEPTEKGGMHKVQLSYDQARSKYHQMKDELYLVKEKEESIRVLHENAYRCWNFLREGGSFDEKTRITTENGHAVNMDVKRGEHQELYYWMAAQKIPFENCPKCIKMLNEAYGLIIEKTSSYRPTNENVTEEKEAALHLAIDILSKKIQELEENEKAFLLILDNQSKQKEANEEKLLNKQILFNMLRQDLKNKVLEENRELKIKNTYLKIYNIPLADDFAKKEINFCIKICYI